MKLVVRAVESHIVRGGDDADAATSRQSVGPSRVRHTAHVCEVSSQTIETLASRSPSQPYIRGRASRPSCTWMSVSPRVWAVGGPVGAPPTCVRGGKSTTLQKRQGDKELSAELVRCDQGGPNANHSLPQWQRRSREKQENMEQQTRSSVTGWQAVGALAYSMDMYVHTCSYPCTADTTPRDPEDLCALAPLRLASMFDVTADPANPGQGRGIALHWQTHQAQDALHRKNKPAEKQQVSK